MSYKVELQVRKDDSWTTEIKEFDDQTAAYVWAGDQVSSRDEVKYYEVYHS